MRGDAISQGGVLLIRQSTVHQIASNSVANVY